MSVKYKILGFGKTFEKAMADIADGADVIDALDAATDEINADIEANDGYGF